MGCHPVEKRPQLVFRGQSLGSHFGCMNAEKSPGVETGLSRRNCLDISKAETQSVMSEFDPSQGSHPVLRPGEVYNLRLTCPEIPAFHAFDFALKLSVSRSRGRNSEKSPALSAEIPVLQRFSAETSSITTAAPTMVLSQFLGPEWNPSPAPPRDDGISVITEFRMVAKIEGGRARSSIATVHPWCGQAAQTLVQEALSPSPSTTRTLCASGSSDCVSS